jgi:hypothetical protein
MKRRPVLSYLRKVPVCSLAFVAGTMLGGVLGGWMHMQM